ncbi:MAG: NAD(P)/FAD-dependent oxidoreductase [Clostridiales bacterium]|nr:NAD(P)/FAD-dependent oxidoreductase [Clostridiales bacterium]
MYDVIIIGRGPAGLSAALYTVRSNLKTLVLGREDSRLKKAAKIDNYFGFAETVSGEELLQAGEKQASRLGCEIVGDEVIALEYGEAIKVKTVNTEYETKSILLATGQSSKKINITNLTEFEGRGVSYCTSCDGFFYNNMKVGVLGYKDYAVHEAEDLSAFSKDITIYTNGMELETRESRQELEKRFKIEQRAVESFEGVEFLQEIKFKDGTKEQLDGIFIAYESASGIDFARTLGILTEGGDVKVDGQQMTNIGGIFAAGDCTGGFKQISTSVGQGAIAGKAITDYIRSLGK